jgi:hypothetical protein
MANKTPLGEMWDITYPLLTKMYEEFKELSKKQPAQPISKQKIKVVNRLLAAVRTVVEGEPSLQFLDLLDEDDIPQQSDVVLMLSQYVGAMDSFRNKYYGWNGTEHAWSR